jgi:hypothetical protein
MLLNSFVSPSFFPYFNLLSLAFPWLMILNVVLCMVWVFLGKKRAIVFIISSLLFYLPTLRWVNFHSSTPEKGSLKVISFNNKGKKSAEDYLNKLNPDLVFLQEAGTIGISMPVLNLKYQTQQDWLLSIYSRYPIVRQGMIVDDVHHVGKAQFADVEINGTVIRCINLYLEPYYFDKKKIKPTNNADNNERIGKKIVKTLIKTYKTHAEQVVVIQDFIKKSPYPILLCGDFNSVPNSYEYYQLSNGLTDAFVEKGNGSATSFHDYKIPIRIDYIFSSKTIFPQSYKVDRTFHESDHFPVLAEFKINK